MSFFEGDPNHGGVTDEDMEAFFANHPDLKPLAPVDGHTAPNGQQFQAGTGIPTPQGGVEPDGGGPAQPTPQAQPPVVDPLDTGAAPVTPPQPAPATPGTPPGPETGTAATPPSPGAPAAVPPPDFVDLGDNVQVPRSQLQAAARFQQQLAGDTQLQQLINNYLTGAPPEGATAAPPAGQVAAPPAGSQPVQPPEDLDMEDASVRALWAMHQQTLREMEELRGGLTSTTQAAQQQIRNQVNGQWQEARTSFMQSRSLAEEDVDRLGQIAARLGVLPQLMQGIDPITGAPVNPDPQKAFERALEIAQYMVPEYRTREFARQVQTMRQESERKKLLGAVGGSSGSAARATTPPPPGSPEAKRAMLAEVGAMMDGSWSDPNRN